MDLVHKCCSHRQPLFSAKPAVTFPAMGHHHSETVLGDKGTQV